MEVLSRSSLPSASLIWQSASGAWTLTFVTKATFQLSPGQATLAASQEPIGEEDSHWDDDPRRSLYAASDLEPLKQRVDVVLVGSAFAPQGQPVRSLLARLSVGEIDKTIEVHLDRVLSPEGARVEGTPFTRMSLSYERAAGGVDTANPIGVRGGARDAYGRIKLPNLQPPGVAGSAATPPVGFGPVPPTWPPRWSKLGRHASSWAPRWLDAAALPDDLDLGFFNAAPADQQLAELPEDARLVLENLHPQIPRLVTQLPALRPRATLEGRGGHHALLLRCDTLWIDTDRGIATMTFRGQLALERADEAGQIVITLDEGSSASAPPPPRSRAERTTDAPPPPRPFLETTYAHEEEGEAIVLPFQRPPATPFVREEALRAGGGLPFASAPPPREERGTPLPFVPAATPWSPPAARISPPALPPPAPSSSQASSPGPTADDSLWSSGTSRFDANPRPAFESPPRQSIGQMVAAAAQEAPITPASIASTASASSRAPGFAATPRRDSGLDPRELLHLLWLKTEAAARICRVPVWRAILDDMEEQRADEAYGSPALASDPAETEDTRDIFDILARGASQDVDQLEAELSAAVRPGGKFVPPLLLLAGELVFPFDERETLRASIAVSTPLSGNDEALKSVIREARDFLAGGDVCPPPIVEGYTARLREAFSRIRKSLSYDVLETQVERSLLEGRHYQKRQVLGMTSIRALLHSSITPSARPVPVYLPDDLARRLPMFTRFRTRMIAELYLQEDQYEQHPGALKVYAIGRVQPHPGDDRRAQDMNRR